MELRRQVSLTDNLDIEGLQSVLDSISDKLAKPYLERRALSRSFRSDPVAELAVVLEELSARENELLASIGVSKYLLDRSIDLKARKDDYSGRCALLLDQETNLRNESESLRRALGQTEERNRDLAREIADLETQVGALTCENVELREATSAPRRSSRFSIDFDEEAAQLLTQNRDLARKLHPGTNSLLEKRCSDLEAVLGKLEEERAELGEKLRKARQDTEKSRELSQELTVRQQELQAKVVDFEVQNESLQAKLSIALAKVEGMREDAVHISGESGLERKKSHRARHLSLISEIKKLEDDDDMQFPQIVRPYVATPDAEEQETIEEEERDEAIFVGSRDWAVGKSTGERANSREIAIDTMQIIDFAPQTITVCHITPAPPPPVPLSVSTFSVWNEAAAVPSCAFPKKESTISAQNSVCIQPSLRSAATTVRNLHVCGEIGETAILPTVTEAERPLKGRRTDLGLCVDRDVFSVFAPMQQPHALGSDHQGEMLPTASQRDQFKSAPNLAISLTNSIAIQSNPAKLLPILSFSTQFSSIFSHRHLLMAISSPSCTCIPAVQREERLLKLCRVDDLYVRSARKLGPVLRISPQTMSRCAVISRVRTYSIQNFSIVEIPCIPINCTACKKKRYAAVPVRRDPLEEYFLLVRDRQVTQAVKLNSPHINSICTASADFLFAKASALNIPFQNVTSHTVAHVGGDTTECDVP